MYLEGFMEDQFEDAELTELEEFLTIFTGENSFNFGEPIHIDYDSSALFAVFSTAIPSVEMLDTMLSTAFEGENLNGFIGMLQSLPSQNVFSTTVFVNQTEAGEMMMVSPSTSSQKRQRMNAAAGVVAGAAGIALLAAGLVYHRRQQEQEGGDVDKPIDENFTVAGETYAGETYAGTWSLDQASESQPFQSNFRQDREDSTINDDREEDEDEDEDCDDMSENCPSPVLTNCDTSDMTSIAMEWEGALHSISLS
jgi:hypothetical protein